MIKPLDHKRLRRKISSSQLEFKTTKEIRSLRQFVGQRRAVEAINFGIKIKNAGYHLYAMGPIGLGKRAIVTSILQGYSHKLPTPLDWCYVYNFDVPEEPLALSLPHGVGAQLQKQMRLLIHELSSHIVAVIESDAYQLGMKRIRNRYNKKRKESEGNLNEQEAESPILFRKQHIQEKKLQTKLISTTIKPFITKIKKQFNQYKTVMKYLDKVQQDIFDNVSDFITETEKTNPITFSIENPLLNKYQINLLVDNTKLRGAPIVFEEAPSYSTLICRVEYTLQLGVLVTNFTLIKPGDLHRANGGFLLIEARKLRRDKEAWEALKSALYSGKIKIKPISHDTDPLKPISLEPMAIPLHIKVILLGDRNTYYSLCQNDPDFIDLFKVAVDFDEEIDLNQHNIQLYADMIAYMVEQSKLNPFHASAVAEVIEESARIAEDAERLTTHIREIENLVQEANYWANQDGKKVVTREYVKKAITAKTERVDRAKHLYYQDIHRDFIIIDTGGRKLGQVNCLSVRRVGNYSYGHPTRVTARVRLGKGKIIDIQRESDMAGSLHTKAGLILANFLSSRFNADQPFALHASISFEQIYCWTDGDSASVGELCALLSALSNVPIIQSLAVTGSIDQYGNVQAVGGINEKIEGFYDICKSRKLTGKQGVIIPAVNVKNLMLKEEIVEAARMKKFAIYPIETVEDAVALLMGLPAGVQKNSNIFVKGSVYDRIDKHLRKFTRHRADGLKAIEIE